MEGRLPSGKPPVVLQEKTSEMGLSLEVGVGRAPVRPVRTA